MLSCNSGECQRCGARWARLQCVSSPHRSAITTRNHRAARAMAIIGSWRPIFESIRMLEGRTAGRLSTFGGEAVPVALVRAFR